MYLEDHSVMGGAPAMELEGYCNGSAISNLFPSHSISPFPIQ